MNCKGSAFCLLLMTFSLATGSHLFDKMVDYIETDGESKRNIAVAALPSDVIYPSMETLGSGIKRIRFRALDQDIELRLESAGDVIADDFTVISGENGEIDRSVDIQSLKRKLYKDAKMGASLHIDEDGPLTIDGYINSKLRIEPDTSKKESKNGRIAHRVMEVKRDENLHCGTKIVPSALKRSLGWKKLLSDDEYIRIEYLFVSERTFTEHFGNDSQSMISYLGKTMNIMEKMFESLDFKIKVAMKGLIKLTKENQEKLAPYIPFYPNYIDGYDLVQNINKFYEKSTDELVMNADIVMLITKRPLGKIDEEGAFRETMGGISFFHGICKPMYKSSISKYYYDIDLAYTMAHESGHLLGCGEDGLDDDRIGAVECPKSDGYIMGGSRSYKHYFEFSPCCQDAFVIKIQSGGANCTIEKYDKKSNRKQIL